MAKLTLEDLFTRDIVLTGRAGPRKDVAPISKRVIGFFDESRRYAKEFHDETAIEQLRLLNQHVGKEGELIVVRGEVIGVVNQGAATGAATTMSADDLRRNYGKVLYWCSASDITARFCFYGERNMFDLGDEATVEGTVLQNMEASYKAPVKGQAYAGARTFGCPFSRLEGVRRYAPQLQSWFDQIRTDD